MTEFTITLHTVDYRGSHAADIARSIRPIDGETVEHLVERVIGHNSNVYPENERIELRVYAREQP